MTSTILIIDDETLTLTNLKRALEKEGYEILLADRGENGLDIFRGHHPAVVLVDLMLPGIDGIEVLKQIKNEDPATVVIMMTAYEILEKAVEAMKHGAYDYLLKPFKIRDLKAAVARGLELQALKIKYTETIESEKGKYYFDRIISVSPAMAEVVATARKIAALEKTTVLVTGESGVGKGMLARAIHYNSPRADQPFIEINCAAIPDTLLESELFGYEPGAFTDARRRKIGLIEKADRGTVFLDEIGDMPLSLQAKILKLLEDQSFIRLGATQPTPVDVRFITATNQNLDEAIAHRTFREDLYYRLNVVPINIPSLKSRPEDIIPLTLSFMSDFNRELHRNYTGITETAGQLLRAYSWPGNVRELKNIIERIMALHPGPEIREDYLPPEIRLGHREIPDPHESNSDKTMMRLDEIEQKYIQEVLAYTSGNKSRAAEILGIHLTTLLRKLKKRS